MNELEGKTELIGSWTMANGRMIDDAVSRIIEDLIDNQLQKIAATSDGWETLYLDPHDRRLWELTFPYGEMHGGGPKALRVLTMSAAKQKYHLPETAPRVE